MMFEDEGTEIEVELTETSNTSNRNGNDTSLLFSLDKDAISAPSTCAVTSAKAAVIAISAITTTAIATPCPPNDD
ncbi:hypothetical protein ACHAXS_008806 [Conticribra weissflogii]